MLYGINDIKRFLKSVHGILSFVPPGLTLFDSITGRLPVSTAIKPWVYILIVLLSSFGIWWEVSKTEVASINAVQKRRMRRSSLWHVIFTVMLIFCYWILGEVLSAWLPISVFFRTVMLCVLAGTLALACLEFTRTFTILALTTMAPESSCPKNISSVFP